jgi:CheY-like chemotaxis protein
MRILVYENSQDRAKLIKDLLDTYRYKTYLNTDNALSVESIKNLKPSLLIVNVNNPLHLELLEKIKRNKQFKRIPLILISSLNSREILDKFPQFPHMDYLVEPFKIKNFRHMVERWVNFRSMYVN